MIDDIRAAAERIKTHARLTPLLSSPFLDDLAGRRIFVKAECLQHTGSFKFRGGWSSISALTEEQKKQGVIAFSSGNHAQGIAAAATAHGVASVILMPADAPQVKIDNTRALGAEVVLYDRAGGESREALGAELVEKRGLNLIPPYDHLDVIAGQGTTGLEIAQQAGEHGIDQAHVVVCAGGGGLTAGIALALEAEAPGMTVHSAEPEGFDDIKRSLEQGDITGHDGGTSGFCDAILTPQPGVMTFPDIKRLCGPGFVVTNEEVKRTMALAFNRLRIVLEPGGAVSLAACLFHSAQMQHDTAIAVATGGNVDPQVFADVLKSYG